MIGPSALPPLARAPVYGAAAVLAVVLTLLSTRYGYHRDELYFRMLPPALGYIDQPPLTPLIARTTTLLVDELWALRLPATLLAAGSVIIIGLVAREVGAGRLAQGLAAWGYAFATFTLTFGHLLLTTSLDLVVWPLVLLFALRVFLRGEPRWWLPMGALIGLSTYNKWLIGLLVISALGGMLLVGPRRTLLSRTLLGGIAIALVLALPNLVWQATHDWPQRAMGRALAEENAGEVRLLTLPMLVVMIGPLLFPIVVAGFVRLLRAPEWRPIRWLAPAVIILVVLTIAGGAQFYYPFGLIAVVYALGCVPAARFAQQSRAGSVLVAVALAGNIAVSIVINLPVLPVKLLAQSFVPTINAGMADQIGWPAYVGQIDRVVWTARDSDPNLVVFTSNYGEAGALDRLSEIVRSIARPDSPSSDGAEPVPVVSGHNALWDLGGPPEGTRTVVVVGAWLNRVDDYFARCTVVDRLASGLAIDNEEEGQPIAVCTDPRESWATLWPRLRHLS